MDHVLVFPTKFAEGANSLGEMDSKFPTAKHEAEVLTLDELLTTDFATDAHFVSYVLVDPDRDLYSRPVRGATHRAAPRVNKPALHTINDGGWRLLAWGAVLDYDLKDNLAEQEIEAAGKGWTQERIEDFNELFSDVKAAMAAKGLAIHTIYRTNHGARFIHRYDQLIDVEDHERILEGLRLEYLKLGLKFDEACSDWTRMMRGPRVLRGKNQTWTQEWFSCGSDPDAWTITSQAPRANRPKAAAKAAVPMYEGEMPTPEECLALFEEPTNGGRGPQRKTELYKKLKTRVQRIDDPHLYAALIHQTPYPFEYGQVNNDMARVVGQLCGRLYGEEYMTGPEPIFAILLPGAEELPTDNPWIDILWSMCVRMWTGEAAQHKAKEIEQQRIEEEERDRMEQLLDNLRGLYPSTAIDQAWAMQHAMAKKGGSIYLMQPDGTFATQPVEVDVLPNAVRALDMEFLVHLEEMRGKNIAYLSGRELLKMYGFGLDGVDYSAGLTAATLRFEGGATRLIVPTHQLRDDVEPRFDEEAHEMFSQAFKPNDLKLLYLWLGLALAVRDMKALLALLIIGDTGSFKTFIVKLLGRCFRSRCVVPASRSDQQFNALLSRSPVIHHEEEVYSGRSGNPAQMLRDQVGGGSDSMIEKKGVDVSGDLYAQPRVVITMNSKARAIRKIIEGQDLGPVDIKAVAERTLLLETNSGAQEWLEEYAAEHGRSCTEGWLDDGTDQRGVGHFLWCYENRDRLRAELEEVGLLPPNSKQLRFQLPSNSHDLFRAQDAESEVNDGLLCSLAQTFTTAPVAFLDAGTGEVARQGGKLYFLAGPLVDRQDVRDFGSTRRRRLEAVDRLCSSGAKEPWRVVPGGKKSRWRELDTDFVIRLLVDRGFEDIADDLAAVRDFVGNSTNDESAA